MDESKVEKALSAILSLTAEELIYLNRMLTDEGDEGLMIVINPKPSPGSSDASEEMGDF